MYIGVEIGGTKIQIAIGNPITGEIEKVFSFRVEQEKGAKGILDLIEKTLNGLQAPPLAIGVGYGGPVDRVPGIVVTSHQIDGWGGFNLKQWLQSRYNVPVIIENDANTAALAEAHFGAGKGYDKMFYVTLGSGVGGGMVVDGKLYHGSTPGESEIGLMHMNKSGETLESLCSGWALDSEIRKVVKSLPDESQLKKIVGANQTGEARFLLSAIEQSDESALKIFSNYVDNLAWGLSHIVHLFNPQIIVLGGGLSSLGVYLAKSVQEGLQLHLAKVYRPGPKIVIAELRENVVPVGALCLLNKCVKDEH